MVGRQSLPVRLTRFSKIYLHNKVIERHESDPLRKAILQIRPFTESGEFTLGVPITEETATAARAGLKVIWDWEEKLRQSGSLQVTDEESLRVRMLLAASAIGRHQLNMLLSKPIGRHPSPIETGF